MPYASSSTSERFDAYCRDMPLESYTLVVGANGIYFTTTDLALAETMEAYTSGDVEAHLDKIGYQGKLSAADNLALAAVYDKIGLADAADEYVKRAGESFG